MFRMVEQVLDLDRRIEGQSGKLRVNRPTQLECVTGCIEEIRIAKRDVLRAHLDLLRDVSEDDVARDKTKQPVVDRHDWTMTAAVFAAARAFRVADDATIRACLQGGIR